MQERHKSNGIAIVLKIVEATGSGAGIRARMQNFTAKNCGSLLEQGLGKDSF